MAQFVKKIPLPIQGTWEMQRSSLCQEDPLEEEITPVFLPENPHGQRSMVGYKSKGSQS